MTYLYFAACVALATWVQNITGFAFALILLGLVSGLQLSSVADAANAASVLSLVNGLVYFRGHRAAPPWRLVRPALGPSVLGVLVGVALLQWLSGHAVHVLRALLGLAIVACAVLLLARRSPLAQVSSPQSFAVAGAVSGVLGGLFSTAGPPLVYHLYRQPLDALLIQRGLLLMFAVGAAVRLLLVGLAGAFSSTALYLSLAAVPVVFVVNAAQRRWPARLDARKTRCWVGGLLVLTGGLLLGRELGA
jgi:uncharacterized protein